MTRHAANSEQTAVHNDHYTKNVATLELADQGQVIQLILDLCVVRVGIM